MKRESAKKGLYVESEERDSCGVGMIADLNGVPTRYVVDSALKILENMEHRGASGYEINSGDGAGILIQIPDYFFRKELEKDGVRLPKKSKYGVGMFFFPKDQRKRGYCESVIKKYLQELDFEWIYTRNVEVDSSFIGETARSSEPDMALLFFKTTAFNYKSIEKRLFLLRSYIMKDIHTKDDTLIDDFYIASLSSKTIVYKGLLTANQLRDYFSDLRHPDFTSSVAIVHSRFSTNTLPKWKLAQPFRCIAHNGEINTIKGNLNWWEARESYMTKVSKERPDFIKAIPVCDPYLSDSGNFDNVVDYLYRVSRSIPHAIMMMIPEAWQNDATIPPYKKAFYEYHDAIMEPWDGPASICFTDGHVLGATLDRNGLRPSRYLL
ncbi:glutamate synthase subunit alpha, partial [Bacteroidia bacterium]|nr:glutamate synthase subunit alpha [Bacteroidia bacterium]